MVFSILSTFYELYLRKTPKKEMNWQLFYFIPNCFFFILVSSSQSSQKLKLGKLVNKVWMNELGSWMNVYFGGDMSQFPANQHLYSQDWFYLVWLYKDNKKDFAKITSSRLHHTDVRILQLWGTLPSCWFEGTNPSRDISAMIQEGNKRNSEAEIDEPTMLTRLVQMCSMMPIMLYSVFTKG